MALTPKQERFCEEYLVDGNGTKAILRAGYDMTEKSAATEANRQLRKPEISGYLQELRALQSKRTRISADYVLGTLTEVVERCMQRAPVMVREGSKMVQEVDADGNHVWKFDSAGVNAALGMLGKHLKLFTEKLEHSGPDGKPIEHKNLTDVPDAELEAKLVALLAKRKEPEE